MHTDPPHATERLGSPQTLLCKKDWRSYKSRFHQYRKDIAALVSLEGMGKKFPGTDTVILKRISDVRSLAEVWLPDRG